MKRRLIMWIVIVCILVVGVSVTRITEDFVVSNGVEASSILTAMDGPGNEAAALYAGEALAGGATGINRTMTEAMAGEEGISAQSVMDNGGKLEANSSQGMESLEAAVGDVEQMEMVEVEESVSETVKSPLDPNVEPGDTTEVEIYEEANRAEDFIERFETVETNSEKLWSNLTSDNAVAYYAAAEQERVLWDYELNLVYGAIRGKLSEDEAEELKHLELEWMKERDQYAEKMALKSPVMNAQNQNPVYTRALAEKTKERCYWLVEEYGDVLDEDSFLVEVKE